MGSEFELSPHATKNVSDTIASEVLMAFMFSFNGFDKWSLRDSMLTTHAQQVLAFAFMPCAFRNY
jgi:hypothetical protein